MGDGFLPSLVSDPWIPLYMVDQILAYFWKEPKPSRMISLKEGFSFATSLSGIELLILQK